MIEITGICIKINKFESIVAKEGHFRALLRFRIKCGETIWKKSC